MSYCFCFEEAHLQFVNSVQLSLPIAHSGSFTLIYHLLFETLADKYRGSKKTNWLNDTARFQKISTHRSAQHHSVLWEPPSWILLLMLSKRRKGTRPGKSELGNRTELPEIVWWVETEGRSSLQPSKLSVCIFNSRSTYFLGNWVILVEER